MADEPVQVSGLQALAILLNGGSVLAESVRDDDQHRELMLLVLQAAEEDRSATLTEALKDHPEGGLITRQLLEIDPGEPPPSTPTLTDEQQLNDAHAILAELADKAKADPGFVFEPETIGALAIVRERDLAGWARVREVLKKAGIALRDLDAAIKRWRAEHAGLRVVDGTFDGGSDRTAGSMIDDAPLPSLIIPYPYFVRANATGVVQQHVDDALGIAVQRETVIAHAPLLMAARLRDNEEGTEAIRLTWKRTSGWLSKTVDRGAALDSRQLVALADDGAPVTSGNAKDLVPYLDALEAANRDQLPCARISSHLGFQGPDGEHGFLVGRQLITPDGEIHDGVNLAETPPEDWREDHVSFRGAATGDEQIADAYRTAGSFDGWKDSVAVLQHYPRALLPFYAAFAPPVLAIVRAPNFVVDISNRTSTGKTTALRAAASVWGNPDERSPDSVIGSWDATRVWLERLSAVLNALPLFLDDTKRAKDPKLVAEMLYAVANGRGRGRGSPKGLARTKAWRTILISTGEAPATSFTQDGGTRMRTLSVRGSPFGAATDDTRRLVDVLNIGTSVSYGHAGPAFVQWLYSCRKDWDDLTGMYQSAVEGYAQRATSAEAGRLAHYAAILTLTASLVHAALELPWAYDDPLTALWDEMAAEASDAAGDLRALRDAVSWAYSHEATFHGRAAFDRDGTPKMPTLGWSGRWDKEGEWEYLAFFPTTLERVLRELKYEPEAILAGWQERGWLDMDQGGRRTRQTRTGGGTATRMFRVTREAIDALD